MIRKVFSEIKNDSFLRKCAVVSFAMFLAFFISVLSVESVLFEKITEDRYKHDAAVVGYLLEKYPQDREIIVKSVIGDNNKYIESGANTLAKYGYTSETSYLIDKSENKVKMMIIFFVFLFAVFSIIILVIAIKAMGYVLKIFESMYSKMKNIFNTVDNIKHSNTLNKNDNKSDNALQERESIENDSVDLNKYNENLLCRINMISEKAEEKYENKHEKNRK